jgi:predicted nucleotidyltransferase
MNKEQSISNYLEEKYNPYVIILHGSRAIGKAREHSDWDIYMLFNNEVPKKSQREEIEGEDVEWKAISLPVDKKKIIDIFGSHLQYAKILFEKENIGTVLLNEAKEVYQEGPKLNEDLKRAHKQFMQHKITGMIDDKNDSHMFLKHFERFHTLAFNFWFLILNNEYPKNYYLAEGIIREKDPTYYQLLEEFVSDTHSRDEKIDLAKKLYKSIFPAEGDFKAT